MPTGSPWRLYLVVLLVLLAGLLAPSGLSGRPSEAAPATPPPQATIQRGAARAGQSPTVLGDINNDGLVDIRDYGLWRQAFGATDCGNPADLDGNCMVDIRDYGIWRQHFGQTGPTPTPIPTATLTSTPTTTPTPGVTGRQVVGYFPLWLRNSGYTEQSVDFSVVTHVAHFAVIPMGDGGIQVPTWGPFPDPPLVSRTHAAGAKVVLAVGGADAGSTSGFATMTASPSTRQTFISNLLALLNAYGYDGADLDWEYPETTGQRDGYTALVRELRAALGSARSLSIPVPASSWWGQWYDVAAMIPYLDWVGDMTYDIHGPNWSGHSGPNAPLYSTAADAPLEGGAALSVDSSRAYYRGRGVPATKLLIGLPFYGVWFDGATAMYQPLTNTTGGPMAYTQIAGLIGNGWTPQRDTAAAVPYLLRDGGSGVISYDDATSIGAKCSYLTAQGLGGAIIWHLGQDLVGGGQPLLGAARGCR